MHTSHDGISFITRKAAQSKYSKHRTNVKYEIIKQNVKMYVKHKITNIRYRNI